MKVDQLDHLVLTVQNIAATCAFYERVLGMEVVEFGNGRKSLHFGNQKINLHQMGHEFEPKADKPTTGSADLCFITQSPVSQILKHLQAHHITLEEGPVSRTGAKGPITSIYIRDPDANLIEMAIYG